MLPLFERTRPGDARLREALDGAPHGVPPDRLVEVPVTLGQKPADAVWLARVDKPTDAQKAAYQAWLGAPWEEPG